jgi:hypothetical protein
MRSLLIVVLALLPVTVSSIECFTCSGKCGCRNPIAEACPPSFKCYTQKSLQNLEIVRKGCALDCQSINRYDRICDVCEGEICNREQSLSPMDGYDECSSQETRGGGIGAGASDSFSSSIGSGANANTQGGIGQGTAYNTDGTGTGARNRNVPVIGGGAAGGMPSGGIGGGASYGSAGGIGSGTGYGASPALGQGASGPSNGEPPVIGGGTAMRHYQQPPPGVGQGVGYNPIYGRNSWNAANTNVLGQWTTALLLSLSIYAALS